MKWLLFMLSLVALVCGYLLIAAVLFVGACVIEALQPKKTAKQYDPIGWLLNAIFGHGHRYPPKDDHRDKS